MPSLLVLNGVEASKILTSCIGDSPLHICKRGGGAGPIDPPLPPVLPYFLPIIWNSRYLYLYICSYSTYVLDTAMRYPSSAHISSSSDIEAQPSRFARASTNNGSTASFQKKHSISDLAESVDNLAQLALAIRSLNGDSILVLIPIHTVVSGEQTWSCIGNFLRRVSTTHHRGTWIETLFARDVVGTAYIHQVSPLFTTALPPVSRSLHRISP